MNVNWDKVDKNVGSFIRVIVILIMLIGVTILLFLAGIYPMLAFICIFRSIEAGVIHGAVALGLAWSTSTTLSFWMICRFISYKGKTLDFSIQM